MARKLGAQNRTGAWVIDRFYGGLADGSKSGIAGSFRFGQGLNYRDDVDQLTANKQLDKDSDTTIDGLVKWMVPHGTTRYFYVDNGDFVSRASNGTYTLIGTISDSHGNGMAIFDDYIYLASDNGLHRYGPLSSTPALETDFLKSPDNEIDQWSGHLSTNTYQLQTSINEGSTHRRTFTPTADTITGAVINIVSKGTGDVTVIVHDASNVEVARKLIANADLANIRTRFEFPGIHDITAGNAYHLHVITSTGTTTIRASTTNDSETIEYATLREFTDEDTDQQNDLTDDVDLSTTYTLPTSISETATNRQSFTPERSTLVGVSVLVADNGTGNWTLTVHDEDERTVATSTIANASVRETKGWVKFTFSEVSIVPSATYHFHLTVSTGTSTVYSDTGSDLEGAAFKTHYAVLSNDEAWHPMISFPGAGALAIGNGNFLAIYDGILYRETGPATGNERLQFAKEESARALELMGDHLFILTTFGSSVNDNSASRMYMWDGSAPSYNAFKDVVGEGHAMKFGQDGLLRVWHGFGQISIYNGALTLVKEIPGIGENKYVEVYPGAVTNWRGLTMFGISDGDSTESIRGVYSYGHLNKNFPQSLNLEFPISTGSMGSTVQVGSILGLGPSELWVGWQDNTSYGVDLIDTTTDQTASSYESLIFDADLNYFEKKASAIKLTFLALTTGQTITVQYKIDRASSWTTLGTASYATDGGVAWKSFAFDKRFKELEVRFVLGTSSSDAPTLTSFYMPFEVIADVQET